MNASPLDRSIHFDIHARADGRWSIHSSADNRVQAVTKAKALLGNRKIEAVKVTREGGMSETEREMHARHNRRRIAV